MTDIRLKYVGNGHFVTATHADYQAAFAEYRIGEEFVAKLSRRRSMKQTNLLRMIFQYAHDSQRAGPQQPTWEHLKAHTLNAVGHCDTKRFAPGSMTQEVAQALRGAFHVEYFVDGKTHEIIQKTPRRTRNLGTEDMSALINKALDYLCRVIMPGTEPDDLKQMAKEAVGKRHEKAPSEDQEPAQSDRA